MKVVESQAIVSYFGEVNNSAVKALVSATETMLDGLGFKKFVTKKINSVLIEILQNLANHSVAAGPEGLPQPKMDLFMEPDGSIRIETSNVVSAEQSDYLRDYLDHLNQLAEDQLRDLYQQKLTNGEFGEKGGAGLGFINIIRKAADKKIRANFAPAAPGYEYFHLQVLI